MLLPWWRWRECGGSSTQDNRAGACQAVLYDTLTSKARQKEARPGKALLCTKSPRAQKQASLSKHRCRGSPSSDRQAHAPERPSCTITRRSMPSGPTYPGDPGLARCSCILIFSSSTGELMNVWMAPAWGQRSGPGLSGATVLALAFAFARATCCTCMEQARV